LVWPEHTQRLARLDAAARIAQVDRLPLVRGDLNDCLAAVAAQAPGNATLVVYHSATLNYVDRQTRARFVNQVCAMKAHWISLEGRNVFPEMAAAVAREPQPDTAVTVVALDGAVRALASPHGGWMRWL